MRHCITFRSTVYTFFIFTFVTSTTTSVDQGIKEIARQRYTSACLCKDAVLLEPVVDSWIMMLSEGVKETDRVFFSSSLVRTRSKSNNTCERNLHKKWNWSLAETDEKRIEKKGRFNDCYHATECFFLSLILCILFSSPSAVCVMLSHPLSPFIPFYLWCTTQI